MASSVLFDAPGPAHGCETRPSRPPQSLAVLILWAIVDKLAGKGQLTAAKWKPFLTGDLWKTYVLPGIAGTLTAAAISIVLAGILGMLLGVGRLSPVRWVRVLCAVIVELFPRRTGADHDDLRVLPLRAVRRVSVTATGFGGRGDRPDALQRCRHRRDRPIRSRFAAARPE